jgi:hypothetical protein
MPGKDFHLPVGVRFEAHVGLAAAPLGNGPFASLAAGAGGSLPLAA